MNYLIITPNNFRIGFDGGYFLPSLNDWRDAAPNLLMRHIDPPALYGGAEQSARNMANTLQRSGAQYMLLNCVQAMYNEDCVLDLDEYIAAINTLLEKSGSNGRVFNFVMGRHYQITTNILKKVTEF